MNIDDLHAGHESIVNIDLVKVLDEIAYNVINHNFCLNTYFTLDEPNRHRSTNQAMQTSREQYRV